MAISKAKVFLIQPAPSYPTRLIYSDDEKTAKENAGSMLMRKTGTGSSTPQLNNDPYLKDSVKFTEVQTQIIEESDTVVHCNYHNQEYFLYKNKPVNLK